MFFVCVFFCGQTILLIKAVERGELPQNHEIMRQVWRTHNFQLLNLIKVRKPFTDADRAAGVMTQKIDKK